MNQEELFLETQLQIASIANGEITKDQVKNYLRQLMDTTSYFVLKDQDEPEEVEWKLDDLQKYGVCDMLIDALTQLKDAYSDEAIRDAYDIACYESGRFVYCGRTYEIAEVNKYDETLRHDNYDPNAQLWRIFDRQRTEAAKTMRKCTIEKNKALDEYLESHPFLKPDEDSTVALKCIYPKPIEEDKENESRKEPKEER